MGNIFKGKSGEALAVAYLKNKGYRILNRNYKTEVGELDIVITDETYLIFVEVKSRSTNRYGVPAEAITYHKRRKINQVASQYIKKFLLQDVPVRFDVVEVYLSENKIVHLENAFDSYLKY